MQFIAEPRFAPGPQSVVAAAGRVFMALGHVAWHQREEPVVNTLIAVNGLNGTLLWKYPLRPGIMVDRSTMIATPTTLYLADDSSCKLLDAASGKLQDEIVIPASLAGGTFWKWTALDHGLLYALIGPAEPADPKTNWKRTEHGWPWQEISKGYNNEKEYPWGFARTLLAIDPKTKKVLWRHDEDPAIDGRSLCMSNGRMFFGHFGRYLTCLDAAGGTVLWRRTVEKDPALFKAIGPYRPGQGWIEGWRSTVYLKCTDKALYFVGPQVSWISALSADDGHYLWKHPAKDTQVVIRDDGLYTIGAQYTLDTRKLDPLSGAVLANFDTCRVSCTRSTGSADGIFFRSAEGTGRLDLASGAMQWISPMRPSCHVGVVIASGHLYWVPWACDCDLQLTGLICCGPAGDFDFQRKASDAERLEIGGATAGSGQSSRLSVVGFRNTGNRQPTTDNARVEAADWPTYRHDNARTAHSEADVPEQAKLLWDYAGKAEPTAPVAVAGRVFTGGADGIVRALDAASGKVCWTAYVGGSVRFPPTIAAGRALVGSGDGWVYAFDAAGGKLRWRFRAAPIERRIPVFGELLSTWPVASGVLVDQGTAYFAAGITDYDGTYVFAIDAATGHIRWQNNQAGRLDAVFEPGRRLPGRTAQERRPALPGRGQRRIARHLRHRRRPLPESTAHQPRLDGLPRLRVATEGREGDRLRADVLLPARHADLRPDGPLAAGRGNGQQRQPGLRAGQGREGSCLAAGGPRGERRQAAVGSPLARRARAVGRGRRGGGPRDRVAAERARRMFRAVVLDLAGDLAATLQSNYSILSNSCLPLELAIIVNLFKMVIYGVHSDLKQFGDQCLSEPNRLILKAALDARTTILRLIEDHRGLGFRHIVGHRFLLRMFGRNR